MVRGSRLSLALMFALATPVAFNFSTQFSASVINADFRSSTVRFEAGPAARQFFVLLHIENSGALNASSTEVTFLLPEDWYYRGSDANIGLVISQERIYGREVVWNVPNVAAGESKDLRLMIEPPALLRQIAGGSFMFAVSSPNARPLFVTIPASTELNALLRTSGPLNILQQLWFYLVLLIQRLWTQI